MRLPPFGFWRQSAAGIDGVEAWDTMKELRLVLLGLAALIALALGAGFLLRALTLSSGGRDSATTMPAVAPAAPPSASGAQVDARAKAARGLIERTIADTPDYTRVFDRMRLLFPGDYEAILSRLADADAGAHEINADKLLLDAMTELRHSHGTEVAKASDEALSRYFAVKAQEVQALGQRDAHLCVVYASGGQATGFLAFWADHRGLVADEAIASLDAMNSGRMTPVKRTIPSDEDLQALDRALVDAGLTRPEISTLLDDQQTTPPISDEQLCKAEQTYMATVSSMPTAARSRLYGLWADLMAKS